MSRNNGLAQRRVVSALPFVKQAGEVTEIARDLFLLVGQGVGRVLDVLEEIRAEDLRHHRALERHFGIEDDEIGELGDEDELEAVAVR